MFRYFDYVAIFARSFFLFEVNEPVTLVLLAFDGLTVWRARQRKTNAETPVVSTYHPA